MVESASSWQDNIMKVMASYIDIVQEGLDERWKCIAIELYEPEPQEVIGAILARQATLTTQLADAPQVWNGHIAPLILRCMTDAHITLAWILKEPIERAKKYILYGLGQEKLYIEHLKSGKASGEDSIVDQLIEVRENWLNSQRHDFLTEVDVGSWSGMTTREMAEEAGCKSLYNYAYLPFSGVVHNMWQHVGIYNLKQCRNPLHNYHRVPIVARAPLDLDFVYRSAKYVSRSFKAVDEKFGLACEIPYPVTWLSDELEKLSASTAEKKQEEETTP
jgi:hypothetical protein